MMPTIPTANAATNTLNTIIQTFFEKDKSFCKYCAKDQNHPKMEDALNSAVFERFCS